MQTLFDRQLDVPPGFENDSVYVFYIQDEGAKPGGAGDAGREMMNQIRGGGAPVPPGAVAGGRFRSNVVVTRQRAEKSLSAVVADMRKQTLESAPNLKLVQEGPTTLAKQAAHQAEYFAILQEPAMQLVQWHVTTVADGYAYTFYCTSEKGRWAADKPRFESFMAGWR